MNLTTSVHLLRLFDGGRIEKQSIETMFCEEDLKIITSMYKEGNIKNILDEESGKVIITLTKKGNFILFIEDNRNDIFEFGKLLDDLNINSSYLYEYLEKYYISNDYIEIFDIDKYETFLQDITKRNNIKTRELLLNNRNIG